MSVFNLPSNFPVNSFTFQLETNTRQSVSPFNRATQTKELSGSRWKATFNLTAKKRDAMAATQAFILALKGGAGRFWAYDFAGTEPQGTGGGTPIIDGSSQTGRILNTKSWNANEIVLKAGDYIQVGDELKMITSDVTSDGTGLAVINFEPSLRKSHADGTSLITSNPSCIMRLIDDNQSTWKVDVAGFYTMSLKAIEVFE